MKKETEIRRGRHVVFNLHVHLVFVTKYRREVFTQAILNDLRSIFATICADFEA
ncbi:IS200/IS605 family transposase, partial [Pasteurella multocida]